MNPTPTFLITLLTAFLSPISVVALSCSAPMVPIDVFNTARSYPNQMSVGYGTLSGTPKQISPNDLSWEGNFAFIGVLFEEGEQTVINNLSVKVSLQCDGPWCGNPVPNAPFDGSNE